jgi:hypothetical protein
MFEAEMDERERRETERKRREAEVGARVERARDAVVAAWPTGAPTLKEHFHSVSAYGPLPHISLWYMFTMDVELEAAKTSRLTAWADRTTREQLSAQGCPMDVVEDMSVIFTTDEEARKAPSAYHFFNDGSNWHSEPKPAKSAGK